VIGVLHHATETGPSTFQNDDVLANHRKKANVWVYGQSQQRYHSAIVAKRPEKWVQIDSKVCNSFWQHFYC